VRAKAIDIHGAESDWSSPLKVTVVKSETLLNWTGYVVDLESYPVVTLSTEAQWIQPSFGEVSRKGFQGTWVGIGGVGEKSKLLQAGVAVIDMVPSWRWIVPFYQAVQGTRKFYEGYGWEYMFNISPNDLIETKIVMVGYNQWQISVADVTKGWTWMPPIVTFDPDMTKAEWIHEPGASGSSVASFTPIDFLKAQLTINSVPYKMGKIDSALNTVLYQFNFARKGTTYTSVSPISAYERFTISYLEAGSLLPQTEVALSLHSNADLHVYDSMGNHLGYNATSGFIDVRIPNSIYFEDEQGVQYAILFNPDKYRVDVVGKENGDFHLRTQALVNETVVLDQWVNETIGINETKTYYFIHQISLRSLAKLKTVIGQGYNCSIGVQVVNNGNYTETFNVTAYANTTIIGTQLVTLTSKNSTNINFTWNTSGFVKGSYTISAYAWPVPGETDKTDNNYTDGMVRVTMKGDCAQEFGVVDIFDLVFVAKAFDTKIGDPGYKPNADLNCDGIIDIFDLVIVAKNFDKTDP